MPDTVFIKHHHSHSCAHAAHQSDRAPAALERAEALCKRLGVRLTPIRRRVLEALYATHHPLGAYDLVQALGGNSRAMAPITVYRALDFLMEQGLVHRLASRNAFIACPHDHGPQDPIAFLICEACGGVDEIASPALSKAVSDVLVREHFTPRMQVLEISGRCAHCREELPRQA